MFELSNGTVKPRLDRIGLGILCYLRYLRALFTDFSGAAVQHGRTLLGDVGLFIVVMARLLVESAPAEIRLFLVYTLIP